MAKSVTALKKVLKREESLLLALTETLSVLSHQDSKVLVRRMIKNKRDDIRRYKEIIKRSAKCPAVEKKRR